MKITMELGFEGLLYRGFEREAESKQELLHFIHYLMWRTPVEMDDETWDELEDVEQILSHTASRWDEHDGCWYIRVLFTDKEFAFDCGGIIEKVIQAYNSNECGNLKSNKAHSYLEGYGTLVEDTEDEEEE